jgi:hypothetical protein
MLDASMLPLVPGRGSTSRLECAGPEDVEAVGHGKQPRARMEHDDPGDGLVSSRNHRPRLALSRPDSGPFGYML